MALCFFLFLLPACKKEMPALPIHQQNLIGILVDIHTAEAAAQHLPPRQRDSISKVYYEQIFAIHHISRDSFERTLGILKEYPGEMSRLYEIVLDSMMRKKNDLSGEPEYE